MIRYLSWVANAGLFVLCCFLLADTANAVFAAMLTATPEEAGAAPPPPTAPSRRWDDRRVILERNLFNASLLAPSTPLPAEDENLEETRLPLRLVGTAAHVDPSRSWAAVQDKSTNKTSVVQIDDEVRPQVPVLRIERRRIVLSEGGSPRELGIDEETPRPPPPREQAAARRNRRVRQRASDERLRRLAEQRLQVPRTDVQQALANPTSLLSDARIVPKWENGEMVGVEVNSIGAGSLFENAGLENGDVVLEINGIPIDDPQQSPRVLTEFSTAEELAIVVRRGGQNVTLNYTVTEE